MICHSLVKAGPALRMWNFLALAHPSREVVSSPCASGTDDEWWGTLYLAVDLFRKRDGVYSQNLGWCCPGRPIKQWIEPSLVTSGNTDFAVLAQEDFSRHARPEKPGCFRHIIEIISFLSFNLLLLFYVGSKIVY